MTPNRIVAVLTPLVFAPAAGAIAAWAAKHAPGVSISQADLTNVFIAGALVALAPAAQWLHGWQKYEERQANAEQAVELAAASSAVALAAPAEDELDDLGDLDELDELAEDDTDDESDPLIAGLATGD